MLSLAWLWLRFRSWIIAAGVALGALLSVWAAGRRSGIDSARAKAAESEQTARRAGDAAAADAERDGAVDRLRRGRF